MKVTCYLFFKQVLKVHIISSAFQGLILDLSIFFRFSSDFRYQIFDSLILLINSRLRIKVASKTVGELKIHYPNSPARIINQNVLSSNIGMDYTKRMDSMIGLENLSFEC